MQSARRFSTARVPKRQAEARLIEKHVAELDKQSYCVLADGAERASLDDMAERLLILQDLMPMVDRQSGFAAARTAMDR